VLDGASEGIALVDRSMRLLVWNPALARLAPGLHVIRGRPLGDLFRDATRTAVLDATARALAGEATRTEVVLPGDDAHHPRVVAIVVSPAINDRGQVDAAVLVGRDITEVRALETRVIRADKLATLGQFAASVVHEVNNPVAAIQMYAEHLSRSLAADAADMARLARIGEAAGRIQALARRLLSYARPDPEPPAAMPIAEVVQQALLYCEPVITEAGVQIERSVDAELPPVQGVRAELTQVLVNLVTNACHAVERGRGRIALAARALPDGYVRVSVEDNGHGIAPAHLPRIFEPFFTTRGAGSGTGLGLSIVRSILEAHGARVRVTSTEATGARFEIDLPAAPR
jgi:signal transduction histidine kinase